MYEFEYVKAASLDDAAKRLANEDAKLVAGGMTLIPTLKMRLAKPTQLVDLSAIPSLKGISEDGDAIAQHHDPVSVPSDKSVMRYEDRRNADLPLQQLQFDLHRFAQLLVQRAQRLVEQHDVRLDDEAAGERHALLLSPR